MRCTCCTRFLHFVSRIDTRNLDLFRRDKLVYVFYLFFLFFYVNSRAKIDRMGQETLAFKKFITKSMPYLAFDGIIEDVRCVYIADF